MFLSWLLLPLLAVVVNGQTERAQPPVSPCPSVYAYGWNQQTGWHGIITIVPPARFSEVQLTVRQSLPYYHPEAGVGRVEVKGGDLAIQEISRKAIRGIPQKIQYHLIFPPFRELPKISAVIFNGKDFCPTQQVFSDTKGRIELKYVLKSGLGIPVASGNLFSVSTDTSTNTDNLIVGLPPHEGHLEPPLLQGYKPSTTKPPFQQGYQPGTTEHPVEVFVIEFEQNKPHGTHNVLPSDPTIGGGERPGYLHFENSQHMSGTESPSTVSSQQFTRPTNRPFGNGQQSRPKPVGSTQQVSGTLRPVGSSQRPKPANSFQQVTGTIRPIDDSYQNRPKPTNTGQHFTGTSTQQNRPRPGDSGHDGSSIHYPSTDNSQTTMAALDERVLQLLTAISKGETVATSRIEQLLMRLIDLTRKRLDLEMKRLMVEEERLHLEATTV